MAFNVDASGAYSVLYSFCSQANCTDGASPVGGVIQDAAGNFHGATSGGGSHGSGTVFRLDPAGRETVLYSFCAVSNCADGSNPQAGVIQDTAGSLYGTTNSGGNAGEVRYPATVWPDGD
jgi:uncharacterized repeat protein (TIGR03803 family)